METNKMQEILSNQLMNAVKIVEEQVEQEIKVIFSIIPQI